VSTLLTVAVTTQLSESEINSVLRLVADAAAVDGVWALNEAALLQLRRTHPTSKHVLVNENEELGGLPPCWSPDLSRARHNSWSLRTTAVRALVLSFCSG
jgi:hypothetical protein